MEIAQATGKKTMNRLTATVLLSASFLVVLFGVFGNYGWLQLSQMKKERGNLQTLNTSLASEIAQTEEEIAKISSDAYEIERTAREQLGLSKDGEVVYVFPSIHQNSLQENESEGKRP